MTEIMDKYLVNEKSDDIGIDADDIGNIGYTFAENCQNCTYSSGPVSDLYCKSPSVRNMAKSSGDILVNRAMKCKFWKKGKFGYNN